MWTGLYLIAFSLFMFWTIIFSLVPNRKMEEMVAYLLWFSLALFPLITIAYSINLIINS